MDAELDEGTFYLTISPTEINPILKGFHEIYNPAPTGAIMPNVFSLVPIIFHFRSIRIITKEKAEKFRRIFNMKIQNLIQRAIEKLLTQIKVVEKWTDVVASGHFAFEENSVILKFEYGEVIRGIFEILVSEMIMETMAWENIYGYKVQVKRTSMDIMLVGSCPNETLLGRFKQRIYDTDFKVSARQWNMGVSYKRTYLWKTFWGDVIKHIC
jgi:hypothetical protein